MNKQQITLVLIGILSICIILYDALALFFWGSESTISVVINLWAFNSHPLLVFILGMVAGGLIVHFFKWKPIVKLRKPRNEK